MRTLQVVIVDDDDLALGTLQRLVSRWGYDVVPFQRFEEARTFLETRTPDALVVDVRLGLYNGLQLAHLARQLSPQMVLIAISGYEDTVLMAEAQRAGATFLMKPIEAEDLRRLLPATSPGFGA